MHSISPADSAVAGSITDQQLYCACVREKNRILRRLSHLKARSLAQLSFVLQSSGSSGVTLQQETRNPLCYFPGYLLNKTAKTTQNTAGLSAQQKGSAIGRSYFYQQTKRLAQSQKTFTGQSSQLYRTGHSSPAVRIFRHLANRFYDNDGRSTRRLSS